ncbi:putative membrane protein [Brevundimonas nasdae]|jgi:uncharacterized membrane protein|uniref:COG3650 family protein n=1 Tax=Brevundimonas nasdae TaxID=172043 RepID=UPI001913D6A6|nr:hypothetical protein [Brevundimonas nasdae]MBK6026568.1 hypothetical protein [Brevundimonas nasdae]MDQ0453229.1 putative membrane protein [Brevundimonas nasdae]
MRRNLIALSALAAVSLSLGACYEREQNKPQSAPVPETQAVLGGVDLAKPVRAVGTEPFWSVDITRDGLTYTRVDQPTRRAPNRGVTVQGTVATFATSTDIKEALNVTLIATECSDGMSDRVYPLTARVEIGNDTLTGCAASTSAIMGAGESGPVVDRPAR